MAVLTSASTYGDAVTEYQETAGYASANSTALAHRHAIAIRFLLRYASNHNVEGHSASFDTKELNANRMEAERFARFAGGADTVVYADFRQVRDN